MESNMLRCCKLGICHKQCDISRDNAFCHDTKCRECNITFLHLENADKYACMCCGYHICEECKTIKGIIYPEGQCPRCGL